MHKYTTFDGYKDVEIHVRMSQHGIGIRFAMKDTKLIVGSSWTVSLMKPFTKEKVEEVSQRMIGWAVQDKVNIYMPDKVVSEIYDWIKAQKDLIS